MPKLLPFKESAPLSVGTELEFQIINPYDLNLISRAKELLKIIEDSPYQERIKPEITQSMIEINSKVHASPKSLYEECLDIKAFLMEQARNLGISFCGGGSHPFQKWPVHKIFPTVRFRTLSRQYRYLSKRATVFGQHIHIGCRQAEDAIYLTHALARYVPHFITLAASSPYFEGIDTGYHSSRLTTFSAFPLSGVMPYLASWEEFSSYFYTMKAWGIIKTMKDFYWDLRPKPEFGTVEIRVFDVPLTLEKAVLWIAYVQTLSYYLLTERPLKLSHELYYLYGYNHFQAARYGFKGHFIDPFTSKNTTIKEDIMETLEKIEPYAKELNNEGYLAQIREYVNHEKNDSTLLRELFASLGSLDGLVKEQCILWGR